VGLWQYYSMAVVRYVAHLGAGRRLSPIFPRRWRHGAPRSRWKGSHQFFLYISCSLFLVPLAHNRSDVRYMRSHTGLWTCFSAWKAALLHDAYGREGGKDWLNGDFPRRSYHTIDLLMQMRTADVGQDLVFLKSPRHTPAY
jgi:hypothetical protein